MQPTLAHIHSSQSTHTRMALQGVEVGHFPIASLCRRSIPKTVLHQFQRDEAPSRALVGLVYHTSRRSSNSSADLVPPQERGLDQRVGLFWRPLGGGNCFFIIGLLGDGLQLFFRVEPGAAPFGIAAAAVLGEGHRGLFVLPRLGGC